MPGRARRLRSDERGAVAPTVALSLIGLIAAGGLAIDYARLASMDTELQNAADQAALAAASQLDGRAPDAATGEVGACARAALAARTMITNHTLLASDGTSTAVTIANEGACDAEGSIRFWQDKGKSTPATNDGNARFVEVSIDGRQVVYALTPIVGALASPSVVATAFAGLGSAICNTPPVMMCNPAEPENNPDPNLAFTAGPGDGIRLVIGSAGTPGNFGFLQTGYGTGAQDLARALGYNNPPADCAATTGVSTEPGDKQAVRAAFNTRFDLSESGQLCPAGGTCSPSRNVRKDLVRGNNCGTSGNQGWQESARPYRPSSPTVPLTPNSTTDPDIMGHPRDMCHAVSIDGSCPAGIIGDGKWDRDAYFRVNYGWDPVQWQSQTGLGADATRYEVYKWELDNPTVADKTQAVSGGTGYSYPVCRAPGVTPNETKPDRRRFSMAVINCEALSVNGRKSGVGVLKWVDVFLVEPAFPRDKGKRTGDGDIYVEVIGETKSASEDAFQVVKKAVPYLIE